MVTTELQVSPFPTTIIISQRDSVPGMVRKAIAWMMAEGNPYEPEQTACEKVYKIHLVQSLPWFVGSTRDIWSPGYPTIQQAAATIEECWGVKVEFTEDGPTCLASEAQP